MRQCGHKHTTTGMSRGVYDPKKSPTPTTKFICLFLISRLSAPIPNINFVSSPLFAHVPKAGEGPMKCGNRVTCQRSLTSGQSTCHFAPDKQETSLTGQNIHHSKWRHSLKGRKRETVGKMYLYFSCTPRIFLGCVLHEIGVIQTVTMNMYLYL